jgi:Tol biopolymer transport system component
MKKLFMVLPLVFLLSFTFSCQQGEEGAKPSLEQTKIAFASIRDGNWEIYVMNTDGSEKTNLTNNPWDDWSPSWSPDGKKIAFMSSRDWNVEIYVMNTDGSEQINLTNNSSYDESPSWSPYLKTGKWQLGKELLPKEGEK